MIFPKRVRFIPCVLGPCIFLAYSCCFVIADEDCYRGEALLDYDNPCSGDPGQPATYDLCHRGQRLEERCTERCVSCDAGINYQNTFTNCSTCLPCKTAADCLPGQIIKSCTVNSDTVCGCPSPPPCPVCPSCPTATPCPLVTTPFPVQTECPACECPTDAPVTTEPQPKLTFIRECPAEKLIGATSGSKLKSVEWEEPLATDGATITQSHRPGDSFVVGNTTVIYVFEIESHSIFCSFVVTVTEETVPPTTPFSRDETTEGNKPETDFQKKNDCNCWPCWILLILLVVVVVIVIIVAGCTCCKEYLPEEWTCCENCLPKAGDPECADQNGGHDGDRECPGQNGGHDGDRECPGQNGGRVQVHLPPAQLNANQRDPEAQQPEVAHNENQGEDIALNRIEQNPQPPGNNDPNGADGTEDGSVGTADADSNRGVGRLDSSDQPPVGDLTSNVMSPSSEAVYSGAHGGNYSADINSRTPLISSQPSPFVSHQNLGPSGVQYLSQNSRTPLIQPQSPTSSALPHQGIDRLSSSDQRPDRDLNSAVAPFSVSSSSAYGVAQGGSDTADSSTQPLLTSSSPSSAMPSQNPGPSRVSSSLQRNHEQLITLREDRRDSPVEEMEIQWLAAKVTKDYSERYENLYRRLNIKINDVNKIKMERLSHNMNKNLETEVFTVINYGWLEKDNPAEEEITRGLLIQQLATFDERLAGEYANYINNWESRSIMGPI